MTGFDDPYVYRGTAVLRNKLAIRDEERLATVERRLATERASAGVPKGNFDLKHLQAIHKHLFQDIYDWAGEVRTVEIAKGGHQFQPRRYIETGMADVHARLVKDRFLRNRRPREFAVKAAEILGDVNYVHPFREGNGRTQLLYLEQLAAQAGYLLDLTRIDPSRWIEASREAHDGRSALMAQCIETCLQRSLDRGR
jgi:cell filamentation protein